MGITAEIRENGAWSYSANYRLVKVEAEECGKSSDFVQILELIDGDPFRIFGSHDIIRAYRRLKKFADSNIGELYKESRKLEKLITDDGALTSYGDKGLAKLNRDFALLSLVLSASWGPRGNRATTEAVKAIATSMTLDPNNMDDANKLMALAEAQNPISKRLLRHHLQAMGVE